jgi:hypothetical protein
LPGSYQPATSTILSPNNPARVLSSYLFYIKFNIIQTSMSRSSKWSPSYRFLYLCNSVLRHSCHKPRPLIPCFITLFTVQSATLLQLLSTAHSLHIACTDTPTTPDYLSVLTSICQFLIFRVATNWTTPDSIFDRGKIFLSGPKFHTGPGAHPLSFSTLTGGFCPTGTRVFPQYSGLML